LVLTALPVALAAAFSMAVIPEISASNSLRDGKSVRASVNTALRLAMGISVPAAVGLAVLADPILALLFPSFPEGGHLLRWGAVTVVLMAFNQILTASLQGVGKVMMPVVAAVFGLIIKIPVNYWLLAVPRINVIGAVISTIACFAVAGALNLFFLYSTTRILPRFDEALIKPVLASAVMGVGCFGLRFVLALIMPDAAATVAALVMGVIIYIAAMVMLRGLEPGDIEALPLPRGLKRWLAQ
jgi:stage V sporulation protein B